MHPAYSVIIFTTSSGAGYGLLALLACLILSGQPVPENPFVTITLGLALALISVGLLSSTFHLGRPERAWRAFSQWRTSWLSREGVLAVVTFVPAGLLFLGSLVFEVSGFLWTLAWLATLVLAIATVACTAMIYASLKTIRQWHSPWVVPVYLVLAAASGAVLLVALLHLFGGQNATIGFAASATLAAGLLIKLGYWHSIDHAKKTHTIGAATGLGGKGPVRQVASPHSGENFIMKEMGYKVARRHAAKLRRLALLFGFVVPAAAIALGTVSGALIGTILSLGAVVVCAIGLSMERWLFFAEAQHVVSLYYGAEAA